jgi:hypothetical protein
MHLPRAFDMGTRLGTLESLETVKIALLRCTRGGWVRVHYRNISHRQRRNPSAQKEAEEQTAKENAPHGSWL